MILGYHKESELPVRRGDFVVIPKGALINRIGTGLTETKRSYKVKVNHVLTGRSVLVGLLRDGEFHGVDDGSVELRKTYGTDKIESLWPLARVDDGYVYLPISNPEIAWAGTGGYWTYCDINQVTKIEDARTS